MNVKAVLAGPLVAVPGPSEQLPYRGKAATNGPAARRILQPRRRVAQRLFRRAAAITAQRKFARIVDTACRRRHAYVVLDDVVVGYTDMEILPQRPSRNFFIILTSKRRTLEKFYHILL